MPCSRAVLCDAAGPCFCLALLMASSRFPFLVSLPSSRKRRLSPDKMFGAFPYPCILYLFVTLCSQAKAQEYTVPQPTIEALYPKGLRVSIPDSDGVELFAFHGNINRPLYQLEAGDMAVDIIRKTNGRWTYQNSQKRLKPGDIIYYWLYVQRDGLGYRLDDQTFQVTELSGLPDEENNTGGSQPELNPRPGNGNVNRPSSLSTQTSSPQYRPPPPDKYPPPSNGYRPPPSDDYRPPPDGHRPPPDEYRPPPDDYRPPPDGHRPPPDGRRPPPDGHRPPPDGHRPPPDGHRPPPDGHRPPPDGHRPPPDGHRPPPDGRWPPPDEYHRPPPDGYRPPPDRYRPPPDDYPPPPPPPEGHHRPPPDDYRPPPPDDYRPPHKHRPPPDDYPPPPPPEDYRPPNGHRPPPPPPDEYRPSNEYQSPDKHRPSQPSHVSTSNLENKPPSSDKYSQPQSQGMYTLSTSSVEDPFRPSTSSETSKPIHHNHHVGFSGSNGGGDRYPNRPVFSSGDKTPLESTSPSSLTSDRFTVSPAVGQTCELSTTTVKGRPACKGQVVFDEKWTTLDRRRWEHEVKISGHPDFEFCVYAQHPENSWVDNGQLHLKPSLTNDKYGPDFIRKGKLQLDDCTAGPSNSDSCWREAMFSYILPPTLAARLNSKKSFSFRYGIIEVRAKLPQGDWIYPEIWLQSQNEEYGPGLSSGRIILAMARGNRILRAAGGGTSGSGSGEDLGGKQLTMGALAGGKGVGSANAKRKYFHKKTDRGFWADQFHNYTLLWTPETLAFSVDGVELGVVRPDLGSGGLLRASAGEEEVPWSRGSKVAPFDKEFFISLGVAVGGVHTFPDGCRSNGIEKPWKNTGAKAMLNFWNAKNQWHPTWSDRSHLLIDSVRVTALNT